MAFDRTSVNYALVAEVMKRDNNEYHERALIDYLMELLDLSGAEVKSTATATLATSLEDRLTYVAPGP